MHSTLMLFFDPLEQTAENQPRVLCTNLFGASVELEKDEIGWRISRVLSTNPQHILLRELAPGRYLTKQEINEIRP